MRSAKFRFVSTSAHTKSDVFDDGESATRSALRRSRIRIKTLTRQRHRGFVHIAAVITFDVVSALSNRRAFL
jgi:hypothetical protein